MKCIVGVGGCADGIGIVPLEDGSSSLSLLFLFEFKSLIGRKFLNRKPPVQKGNQYLNLGCGNSSFSMNHVRRTFLAYLLGFGTYFCFVIKKEENGKKGRWISKMENFSNSQ